MNPRPDTRPDPRDEIEREIEAYGRWLDSSIRLPGGLRIGWDGIIGLIPGFGDAVGLGLSAWLVMRASSLGLPRSVILRMVFNILIETVIGAIPVLGDAFDFVFKANNRNVTLMKNALKRDADHVMDTTKA